MTRGEISERQESNAESTVFSIADLSIYFHLLPTAHILPRAGEENKTNVRETEAPGRAGGGEGVRGMFVLTTEHELTKEAKRILREQFKKETGEDCIVLDLGMKVTQISVKKDSATGGNR